MKLDFKPAGPVAKAFMRDGSFVRGIRGPVGSGKSVTCCMEIMRKAVTQAPNSAGVRRTRWAVIRNTNPQLKTTTIKTWRDSRTRLAGLCGVLPTRILSTSPWEIKRQLSAR